jgi:DNA-binding NarL/FixJ family response regulator
MVLNMADVITDISLGVPTWHIIEESIIVLAAALTLIYLLIEMRSRSKQLEQLTQNLSQVDQQLANITQEMRSARRQYSQLIQQQFEAWNLTDSEQQVAMLLLKGLSFKEIAVVRDTREKTVRQQASTIYAKSGVEGRHAFAAWFLEDFLTAQPLVSVATAAAAS